MINYTLLLFPLLWLALLAALYFFKGYKLKDLEPKLLLLYVVFMATLGPVGEIFVGTIYETVVDQPLWQYQVMPTHDGYTSLYAPVIWGVSGAFLYVFHELMGIFKQKSRWFQVGFRTFETISLEAALNISFFLLSGGLIFYYLPGDLFHITSLQTLPFYYILNILIVKSMKRIKRSPVFFCAFFILILLVTVYMTH